MLTEEHIKRFTEAMKGPAPAHDPQWEATRQLLATVAIQSRHIINLQAQLDALTRSNNAGTEGLVRAIQLNADKGIAKTKMSPEEVKKAADALQTAIEASARGDKVASYAGSVLRFAAKLVLPL